MFSQPGRGLMGQRCTLFSFTSTAGMTEAAAEDTTHRGATAAYDGIPITATAAAAVEEMSAGVGTGIAIRVGLLVVVTVNAIAILVAAHESTAGRQKQEAGRNLAGTAHVPTHDEARRQSAQA